MSAPWLQDERVLDLLVREAGEGLDAAERRELEALLGDALDEARAQIGTAAAAVALAGTPREPMPAGVRANLQALQLPERSVSASVTPLQPRARPSRATAPAWWAAAACLVLAIAGWWPRLGERPVERPAAPAVPTREQLAARSGAVQLPFTRGPDADAAQLTGDVVFDPATQRGYLRFRNLPPNDRRLGQYQLWIVDGSRTQPQPVDGGVFDVTAAGGEVLIPFEPRLPVGRAAAFVVTFERTGGVVVSAQERVLAIARGA